MRSIILISKHSKKLDKAIAKAEASGYVGPFATWEEAKAAILADDENNHIDEHDLIMHMICSKEQKTVNQS